MSSNDSTSPATTSPDSTNTQSALRRPTAVEIGLGLACLALLVIAVLLLVALDQETAPLEPAWGSWAEWGGLVVTFAGFSAAIITVVQQGRTLRLQEAKHQAGLQERAATVAAAEAREAAKVLHQQRAWANAFQVNAHATHHRKLSGHDHPDDGTVTLECTVLAPQGGDAIDITLDVPDLGEGYKEQWDRPKTSIGHLGEPLGWKVKGPATFEGKDADADATKWLSDRTAAEFTDPNGLRWKKYGNGTLQELPVGP